MGSVFRRFRSWGLLGFVPLLHVHFQFFLVTLISRTAHCGSTVLSLEIGIRKGKEKARLRVSVNYIHVFFYTLNPAFSLPLRSQFPEKVR
ncbi:hypothetical protein QBC45DRAFT_408119 [Copromyces sp. CBS 386.78]|nr:hypothetical protein QBC45DRAFT_408119 [Copromyces sp. CBS 386.78]